jgi:hypothetical protein
MEDARHCSVPTYSTYVNGPCFQDQATFFGHSPDSVAVAQSHTIQNSTIQLGNSYSDANYCDNNESGLA